MTDDLSDQLRRVVDQASPVELDEVTHRHPVRDRHPWRLAVAGLAVAAAVAGGVALLRVDRAEEEAPPVATTPSSAPAPVPTTTAAPASSTTVKDEPAPPGNVPQFVGVTTDGRLVLVEVSSGEEVLELARMADPTAPHDGSEGPAPNYIESADVVAMSPGQVLYGDCCEPASGNVFAIGLDGSPTTFPVLDHYDEHAYVGIGTSPVANTAGEVAVATGSPGIAVFRPGELQAPVIYETGGYATSPAWIAADPYVLAYEADGRGVGLLTEDPTAPPVVYEPEGDAEWTDPVHAGDGILVVEDGSTGRVIDPQTGDVLRSFPFDGVVVDLDTSVTGGILATFQDGRVATIDGFTGDSHVIATGFAAASW
jgi:hypothetical protein